MKNGPTISVAMTTFNGEKYLGEQLDSILGQTLPPDEIIVVDDGSSDHTVEILKKYSALCNLKYWVNEANLGVNRNFARAMKLASGDFIALSDQDDGWLPANLEVKFKKILEYPPAAWNLVAAPSVVCDSSLNKLFSIKLPRDVDDFQSGVLINLQGATMLLNRAFAEVLIDKIPEKFSSFSYDTFTELAALLYGNVYILAQPLTLYRVHNANVEMKLAVKKWNFIHELLVPLHNLNLSSQRMEQLMACVSLFGAQKKIPKFFENLMGCYGGGRVHWFRFFRSDTYPLGKKALIFFSTLLMRGRGVLNRLIGKLRAPRGNPGKK